MDGEPDYMSDTGTNCNLHTTSETYPENLNKLETLEKKAVHLRLVLEKDFKAADMKWSLFVAAAFSFRYESCLKPFPPGYWKNGIKDMDELLSTITDVPALDLLLRQLDNLDDLKSYAEIIDLLFYVLVRLKEPIIKTVPIESHGNVLLHVNSTVPAAKPQYVFQVVSSNKSTAEVKWRELAKNHNVFYAFHGNRLENFYSMLHCGIQQKPMCSTGGGMFLSPELSASLPHSAGGFGWGASCLGGHLACVALCEILDVPEGINYQRPVTNQGDGGYDDSRSVDRKSNADEAIYKQLPNYYVTNAELVRVRYLLIYAKPLASSRLPTGHNKKDGGIRKWFARHKLFSILFGYGLMLATIGLANNQPLHYYFKMFMKKLELAYSNVKVS
ncbi:protein mono-ADP-ribosyltransferase PARP16 [Plutella xylostella]|uniref:protein mono-ADP-ribosyltransferase PARP16 n=1 Tax=Plutella xylostella TaxID=51655 RepID=UPI0020327D7E|nr:protein mono-ADP-ribosyltransferase PARP16 [Plutella xylostella]